MTARWRTLFWFLSPPTFAGVGVASMTLVTRHFEWTTGRPFYGLAAVMHSVPDWGTTYHLGGHVIEMWAVDVPCGTTLALLIISAAAVVVCERNRWRPARTVACVVWHAAIAVAFLLVAGWFSINITGVFI
jgi:hypothetical protein